MAIATDILNRHDATTLAFAQIRIAADLLTDITEGGDHTCDQVAYLATMILDHVKDGDQAATALWALIKDARTKLAA